MASSANTPHWDKNLQHKQRQPNQRPSQQRARQQRPNDFGGFDSLLVGKEGVMKLGNGEVIKGVVSAASKYFYLVSVDGQVLIVNKAWVVSIMPVQNQNKNNGASTLVGTSTGLGGDNERGK
jgi:sRNA-binding regulator protein Hfq